LVGGLVHKEQKFHAVISEAGSGLILVAGFALMIPSAFFSSLRGSTVPEGEEGYTAARLRSDTLNISHGVSIILIVAFLLYLAYNALSHDNIFQEVLEADEEADIDRHRDLKKAKLTLTECVVAIGLALALISLIAVFLVEEIEFVVENGVPDTFLGLILVPLVEKAAEHLTAIDEAYDNQIVSCSPEISLWPWLTRGCRTSLFTTVSGPQSRLLSSMHHLLSLSAGALVNPWISTSRSLWSCSSFFPSWWLATSSGMDHPTTLRAACLWYVLACLEPSKIQRLTRIAADCVYYHCSDRLVLSKFRTNDFKRAF
jgi:hypothetical protein